MRPRAIAATRSSLVSLERHRGREREERFRNTAFFVSATDSCSSSKRPADHFSVGAAASFRAISAARLNVSQRSHLRPIDVVVYDGPRRRPHLGAGFALRCPQRLSVPDAATRLRGWRHDRHTVGPSDPVLSY